MPRPDPLTPAPAPLTLRSARIKQARRLGTRAFRRKSGQFLVEGPQAVREALNQPGVVQEIYAELGAADRHRELRDRARAARIGWHPADVKALEALTDTVTSQGLVAVCRVLESTLAEAIDNGPKLLAVGVQVRDPGNAGTLIRCADAAGADAVLLSVESVDPHNPKAVRASVGSLFHLPVVTGLDAVDTIATLQQKGIQVLAADGYGDLDLDDCIASGQLDGPTAWLFGNEAHGLPDLVCARADRMVRVPIYGQAESLNLATAAAVCLYASARAQRRPRAAESRH